MLNKIAFSLVFLLVSLNGFTQETKVLIKGQDDTYSYEKTYDVPGRKKEEIYASLKDWVVKNVKSQSNANYFDEKENGLITTTIEHTCSISSSVNYKLTIEIKDNKYRLSAASFIWVNMYGIPKKLGDFSGLYMRKIEKRKVFDDIDDNFTKVLIALEKASKSSTDW